MSTSSGQVRLSITETFNKPPAVEPFTKRASLTQSLTHDPITIVHHVNGTYTPDNDFRVLVPSSEIQTFETMALQVSAPVGLLMRSSTGSDIFRMTIQNVIVLNLTGFDAAPTLIQLRSDETQNTNHSAITQGTELQYWAIMYNRS